MRLGWARARYWLTVPRCAAQFHVPGALQGSPAHPGSSTTTWRWKKRWPSNRLWTTWPRSDRHTHPQVDWPERKYRGSLRFHRRCDRHINYRFGRSLGVYSLAATSGVAQRSCAEH